MSEEYQMGGQKAKKNQKVVTSIFENVQGTTQSSLLHPYELHPFVVFSSH